MCVVPSCIILARTETKPNRSNYECWEVLYLALVSLPCLSGCAPSISPGDYVFTQQSSQGRVFVAEQSSSEKYKQQTTIIWRLGSLLTEIRQDAAAQSTMMEVSKLSSLQKWK